MRLVLSLSFVCKGLMAFVVGRFLELEVEELKARLPIDSD